MNLKPLAKELIKLLVFLLENDTDYCTLTVELYGGKTFECNIKYNPID